MGSLTVRNLPEAVKKRLRLRAAANGRSMEEEVRLLLAEGAADVVIATTQFVRTSAVSDGKSFLGTAAIAPGFRFGTAQSHTEDHRHDFEISTARRAGCRDPGRSCCILAGTASEPAGSKLS